MESNQNNIPEVKLGQYKGLAVTRHVRGLSEKTLDIEMVHQTRLHAFYHNSEEGAKRGTASCWILRASWTARRSPTAGWKRSWSCWATAS